MQEGITTIYGYDMEWYIKSYSVKGEYLNYNAKNLYKLNSGFNHSSDGYYVAATFLLTGEEKKRNDFIKPKKEFDPGKGGWGAFELTARYEKTNLSRTNLSAIADGTDGLASFTGGLNWYLNDDVKVVMNYSTSDFKKDILINDKLYQKSNTLLLRVQYQFKKLSK